MSWSKFSFRLTFQKTLGRGAAKYMPHSLSSPPCIPHPNFVSSRQPKSEPVLNSKWKRCQPYSFIKVRATIERESIWFITAASPVSPPLPLFHLYCYLKSSFSKIWRWRCDRQFHSSVRRFGQWCMRLRSGELSHGARDASGRRGLRQSDSK